MPGRDDVNDPGAQPQIKIFMAHDAFERYGIDRYYFTFELPIANQHIFIRSRASGNEFQRLPSKSQIYNAEGIFGDIADVYIAKGQQNNALSILSPDTMADMLHLLKTCDIEIYGRTVYIVNFTDQLQQVKHLAKEMYQDALRRADKSQPLQDAYLVEHPLEYSITTAGGMSWGRTATVLGMLAFGFIATNYLRASYSQPTTRVIVTIITFVVLAIIFAVGQYLVRRKRNKLGSAITNDFSDKSWFKPTL